MKTSLYAAYGSNLNHEQMKIRCPNAKFYKNAVLRDYCLVFRGVADIEHCSNECVEIGLWEVTDECIDSLDRYEGYPYLYGKAIGSFETDKENIDAMIYFMESDRGYFPPSSQYLNSIKQGYKDCNLNEILLNKAVVRNENDILSVEMFS